MTPIRITLTHWTNHCKEYVARIDGSDAKYTFNRVFISPDKRDWSRSGKRGTTEFVVSKPGLYEIQEPSAGVYGGQDARRYFVLTESGETESITFDEARRRVGDVKADARSVDV